MHVVYRFTNVVEILHFKQVCLRGTKALPIDVSRQKSIYTVNFCLYHRGEQSRLNTVQDRSIVSITNGHLNIARTY